MLHQRAADGSVDEWTQFEVGPIDDALFTWSGPSRTLEEVRREAIARDDEERTRRRQWFRDNVTDVPLRARVEADLPVDYVHTFDDNGAFEASIGQRSLRGSLARRPRSAEPWELQWSRTPDMDRRRTQETPGQPPSTALNASRNAQ